jgi:Zn-dependent oligopeptidase
MSSTRRKALVVLLTPVAIAGEAAQQQQPDNRRTFPDSNPDEDTRLPNGKSQKDAISKQAHEDALKDVESLIHLAEDLRDELKHSGEYVVALSSVRKTEEIEKLARHIRGKLKA